MPSLPSLPPFEEDSAEADLDDRSVPDEDLNSHLSPIHSSPMHIQHSSICEFAYFSLKKVVVAGHGGRSSRKSQQDSFESTKTNFPD
jgi:hypothetical protein